MDTINLLVGALLGFGLTQLQIYFQQRKTNKNIRKAISIEIDQNLKVLQNIMEYINRTFGPPRENALDQALQQNDIHLWLAGNEMMDWSHKVWESLLSASPAALTGEEFARIHTFHADLEWVTKIQTRNPDGPLFTGAWLEVEIERLLEARNPLPQSKTYIERVKRRWAQLKTEIGVS